MKIPHKLTSEVQPSHQTLGYLSDRGATPNAFGAQIGGALSDLGRAFGSLAAELKDRDEKTKKYKLLNDVTDFQNQTAKELEEKKRSADPGAGGFFKSSQSWYEERENEFIKQHSDFPEEEVRYRLGGARTTVFGGAFDFQMKEGDRFFDQGVKDSVDEAKRSIEEDSSEENLAKWTAHIAERVATSALPPAEKERWKREIPDALASQAYLVRNKGKYKTDASYFAWLGGRENSTGNPRAKNPNSTATGKYQFTIDTWKRLMREYPELGLTIDGRVDNEQQDKAIRAFTAENAAILAKNGLPATYGNLYALHFLGGAGGLKALQASDDTPIRNIVSPAAMKANPHLKGWTVARFKLWLLERTGKVGSSTYVSQEVMDSDPIYNVIPPDKFTALREDAVVRGKQADSEGAKINKEQHDAEISSLRTAVERGEAGKAEIEEAFQAGLFRDHAEYNGTLDVLARKKGAVDNLANANAFFGDEKHVWLNNKLHRDALDAYYADAPRRLAGLDQNYITDEVLPGVRQSQLIPGVVEDALTALSNDRDAQRMLFGLDALNMLRENAYSAFSRLPEDVQRRVERYAALQDSLPAEVLIERMRGGASATERKLREELREEAEKIILKEPNKITNRITNMFDTVFGMEPSTYEYAPAARAMRYEYTELFKENYAIINDESKAHEATEAQLKRTWGVSELGGAKRVMKFAPHAMGYSETRDQFVDEQIREEFNLGPDTQYALFGDERTYTEAQQANAGKREGLPSYTIAVNDPVKGWRVQTDENGRPLRYHFEMNKDFLAREVWSFERKELEAKLSRAMTKATETYGKNPDMIAQANQEMADARDELYLHDVADPSKKVEVPEITGTIEGPNIDLRETLLGLGENNVPEVKKNMLIFAIGDKYYVVPRLGGEHPDQAQKHFTDTGEHLGAFESSYQAKAYINGLANKYREMWSTEEPEPIHADQP